MDGRKDMVDHFPDNPPYNLRTTGDAIYSVDKLSKTPYNHFPAPIAKNLGRFTGVTFFSRDTQGGVGD